MNPTRSKRCQSKYEKRKLITPVFTPPLVAFLDSRRRDAGVMAAAKRRLQERDHVLVAVLGAEVIRAQLVVVVVNFQTSRLRAVGIEQLLGNRGEVAFQANFGVLGLGLGEQDPLFGIHRVCPPRLRV
jgi:hypothetical protein